MGRDDGGVRVRLWPLVDGDSWSALLENYDVSAGKVWSLVPTAMAVGPELARRAAAGHVTYTPRTLA
jgi:hypothetical protein